MNFLLRKKLMTQPSESPAEAALAAAKVVQHLAPGPLAELRRMEPGTAAPTFWRLVARHPETIGKPNREQEWLNIIRILAVLTPKGDPESRSSLHNPKRRLGQVLCDGGNPDWTGPRPALSEHRLMMLMAARGQQRTVLLTRAARAIARSMSPGSGVNVPDIAYAVLLPGNDRHLAEHYYRRLDRASVNQSEEGTPQ